METRFYIGLLDDGCRVSLKIGPTDPDRFLVPPYQPSGDLGLTYYQVSQEIAEQWVEEEGNACMMSIP